MKPTLRNNTNTVGVVKFKKPFDSKKDFIYTLGNLKQAIKILESIVEDRETEIRLNILKEEAGPLLTMRTEEDSDIVIVVCPIVKGRDAP